MAEEQGPATRASAVVFTYGKRKRRREELLERLASAHSAVSALTALLMVTAVLQILLQVPEVYLLATRLREVVFLSPEEVLRRYPEVYWFAYNAPLYAILLHAGFQMALHAVKKPRVALVLTGPLFYLDAALASAAYALSVLGLAVTKNPVYAVYTAVYFAALYGLSSGSARRLLERVEEAAGKRQEGG
jgi:hypothetical protein